MTKGCGGETVKPEEITPDYVRETIRDMEEMQQHDDHLCTDLALPFLRRLLADIERAKIAIDPCPEHKNGYAVLPELRIELGGLDFMNAMKTALRCGRCAVIFEGWHLRLGEFPEGPEAASHPVTIRFNDLRDDGPGAPDVVEPGDISPGAGGGEP